MVPPGPEAWKRLRAPRTYICNIDLWPYFCSIFTVTLFARKWFYVTDNYFYTTCSKTTQYVERGLLHLNINIVYS